MNQYIFIAAYIVLCLLVAFLGRNRKWGFWGYLWSSILFSPLMGMLFILAADPRENNAQASKK